VLPAEVFESTEPMTGLAFSVYPESSLFPLDSVLSRSNFVVGTPVVGATVADRVVQNLTEPVIITLPIIVNTEVWICISY